MITPGEFRAAVDSAATALAAAEGLAAAGVPVFPCAADKAPLTAHGYKDASCNPAVVRGWFAHADAGLTVGAVPAGAGLAVMDLDTVHGGLGLAAAQVELHTGVDAFGHPHQIRTPSGGVHLWFATGPGTAPAVANSRWPAVDIRGEGGYVIVWAPGGGYRLDAWDMSPDWQWLEWPLPESGRVAAAPPADDAELYRLLETRSGSRTDPATERYVLAALTGVGPGNRHAAGLTALGRLFGATGVNLRELLAKVRQIWIGLPGDSAGRDAEWDAMVAWVAGQESAERAAAAAPPRIEWAPTPPGVAAAVAGLGFGVRFNSRRQRMEVSIPEDLRVSGQGDWEPVSEHVEALLVVTVAERCGAVTAMRRWREWLTWCLVGKPPVDPFVEWLEALPAWDGVERLDDWLTIFEPAPTTPPAVVRFVSRLIPMAVVARALRPGCGADIMPVLVGPQGMGKSRTLRALMADREWFSDSLSLHDDLKVWVEKSLGPCLIEVAEMSGASRQETAKLKSLLSATKDEVRLAYRRDAGEYPRRFFPVGTANDRRTLPNDPTGNRRFAVVNFVGNTPDFPNADAAVAAVTEQRGALFGEALARIRAGEGLFPSAETAGLLATTAEGARMDDSEIESIVNSFLEGRGSRFHVGGLIRKTGAWVEPVSGEQLPSRGLDTRVIRALEHAGCVRDAHKSRGRMEGDEKSVVRYWWTPPGGITEDAVDNVAAINPRGLPRFEERERI